MIKSFKGKYYKVPGTNINIITVEGVKAVEEAIEYLKSKKPESPLLNSQGLYRAAKDHCVDIGNNGIASHEGSDGLRMCDRIEVYGDWKISIAENICFDDYDPVEIIIGLIVDDGNSSRGHRSNLFNPDFK